MTMLISKSDSNHWTIQLNTRVLKKLILNSGKFMDNDYWTHGAMHNLGWLWLWVWIPIIILIAWGMTKIYAPKETESGNPMEILKKRYAKGEITTEEYEERKKILLRDSSS
jgi:putative membrane protein